MHKFGNEQYSRVKSSALCCFVFAQAQDDLLQHKAQAAELAQKLAEDVAMTEDLQNELTVLEDDFNAVKKDRAGNHLVTEVECCAP